MNIREFIKHFFSNGDYEEGITQPNIDHSDDQESYYVPPFDDQNTLNENPSTDTTIHLSETDSSCSTNNTNVVLNQEDTANYFSDLESKSENHDEKTFNETAQHVESEILSHLQKDVISIIEEFDSYLLRIENDDAKALISLFQHRLIESLLESGLKKIDNDKMYNCLRHTLVPYDVIPNGIPIRDIKRCGLINGNHVVLKAQVTV